MIRIVDIILSVLGLIILSPVFIILALYVRFTSAGPVFYRQVRIGKGSAEFRLFKFRSMYIDSDKRGLLITVSGRDPRITPAGYILRKYKLDELPQLFNVLFGHMSLVGPRPEVKRYVDLYTPLQQQVLTVRPGITDLASVLLSDENIVLGRVDDPETFYISVLMPLKIRLNKVYIAHRSVRKYLTVIGWTFLKIINALPSRVAVTQQLLDKWMDTRVAAYKATQQ